MGKNKARVIAFYLPQYHPIPENDYYWGKGFTEWTNVASAQPLYKGHYQPRIPADLGFYDLRLQQVQEQQAEMAREAGVEGFMYWHYWFGNGKMLLEKPLENVVASGKPDFPFCYGWANHNWATTTWLKGKASADKTLIAECKYLGEEDNKKHFEYCLSAFKDHRYIKVDGKLLFFIYAPLDFVGLKDFMNLWNRLAKENGLEGFYFVGDCRHKGETADRILSLGLDAVCNNVRIYAEEKASGSKLWQRVKSRLGFKHGWLLDKYDYKKVMENFFFKDNYREECIPVVTPGYDRTARAGRRAKIYSNPSPETFQWHLHETLKYVKQKSEEHRIIFLDSWNEWGEGNYVEPDTKFGHAYLDSIKAEIK